MFCCCAARHEPPPPEGPSSEMRHNPTLRPSDAISEYGRASAGDGGAAPARPSGGRLSLSPLAPKPDDFTWGKTIGEGAYAKVVHARCKAERCATLGLPAPGDPAAGPLGASDLAIKVMDKMDIVKAQKMKYVMSERDCLARLRHPHIVRLVLTFQDADFLYLAFEVNTQRLKLCF